MHHVTQKALEAKLVQLLERAAGSSLTIGDIVSILVGKGHALFLIVLSLPFCFPIQIPGLSTPFGILIALVGMRISFGHHLWLPAYLLKKEVTSDALEKIVEKLLWLMRKIRLVTRARLMFLTLSKTSLFINGLLIVFLGLLLALPLPMPSTNMITAWPLLLFGFGLLEDDGLFVLVAYLLTVVAFFYFVSLILLADIALYNLTG